MLTMSILTKTIIAVIILFNILIIAFNYGAHKK